MKKTLTVVSFVSIFAIAAFLLFEGILSKQEENLLRRSNKKLATVKPSHQQLLLN